MNSSQDVPLFNVSFGETPARHIDKTNASHALHGWPESASEADSDVGKATKPGVRNTPDGTLNGTAFGMQTEAALLRQSISRVGKRNSSTVKTGVGQTFTSSKGMYEEDWKRERSKDELKDIVFSSGIPIEDPEFEETMQEILKTKATLSVDVFHKTFVSLQSKKIMNMSS